MVKPSVPTTFTKKKKPVWNLIGEHLYLNISVEFLSAAVHQLFTRPC